MAESKAEKLGLDNADSISNRKTAAEYWVIQQCIDDMAESPITMATDEDIKQAMIDSKIPAKPFNLKVGLQRVASNLKAKGIDVNHGSMSKSYNKHVHDVRVLESHGATPYSNVGLTIPTSTNLEGGVHYILTGAIRPDDALNDNTEAKLYSAIGKRYNHVNNITLKHSKYPNRKIYYLDNNNNVRAYKVHSYYPDFVNKANWTPATNRIIKRSSVFDMHDEFNSYRRKHGVKPLHVIEVSSAARNRDGNYGYNASAMHLTTGGNKNSPRVEQVYQASKVFVDRNGRYHQFKQVRNDSPFKAKKEVKNLSRGMKLAYFNPFGYKIPLRSGHLDYDWIYVMSMYNNSRNGLNNHIAKGRAFGDMYANFYKTFNTQAEACALYASLAQNGHLNRVVNAGRRGPEAFLKAMPSSLKGVVIGNQQSRQANEGKSYNNNSRNYDGNKHKNNNYDNSKHESKADSGSKIKLKDIMKVYSRFDTSRNIDKVMNVIGEDHLYPKRMAKKGLKVLEHLNDVGASFELKPNTYKSDEHKNPYWNLDATNINGTNSTVRVLEDGKKQESKFVGRIKTERGYVGCYYLRDYSRNNRAEALRTIARESPNYLIDYITGVRSGTVINDSSNNRLMMHIEGAPSNLLVNFRKPKSKIFDLSSSRNQLATKMAKDYVKNISNKPGAKAPKSPSDKWESAGQWYLATKTQTAKTVFNDLLLGESLKGSDDIISGYQDELQHQIRQDPEIMHKYTNLGHQSNMNGFMANVKHYYDDRAHAKDNPIYDKIINRANDMADSVIGHYDMGKTDNKFNPSAVISLNKKVVSGNPTNAMYVAMLLAHVDSNKEITDNDSNTKIKDHIIRFDKNHVAYQAGMPTNNLSPEGAKYVEILNGIRDYLAKSGISSDQTFGSRGSQINSINRIPKPSVAMDNKGIVYWTGYRLSGSNSKISQRINSHRRDPRKAFSIINPSSKYRRQFVYSEPMSGEIGQVFVPDKHHILRTNYNSGDNKEIIPMSKAYFQYAGTNKSVPRMRRLAVSDYDSLLRTRIHLALDSQITRDPVSFTNRDVTSPRDDAILNGLYTSDIAGAIYSNGWYEHSHLSPEDTKASAKNSPKVRADIRASQHFKNAIINSIYNSYRFPAAYTDMSTTMNSYNLKHGSKLKMSAAKRDSVITGHKNMRNLNSPITRHGNIMVYLDEKTHRPLMDERDSSGKLKEIGRPRNRALFVQPKILKKYHLRPVPEYSGYFDTSATATGKRQGENLYGAQGSGRYYDPISHVQRIRPVGKRDFTGNLVRMNNNGQPVLDENGHPVYTDASGEIPRCPIRNLPIEKYDSYNSADRRSAIFNIIKQSLKIAPNTHVAMSTFGSHTFDDAIIVSKNFADKYKVHPTDADGNVQYDKWRSLRPGDKLSDIGFNKFTIGMIVDPNTPMDYARKHHIEKEVSAFKQNPELDCVMAPYAHMTRTNPSADLEMMGHNTGKDVSFKDPDTGKKISLGPENTMTQIVTNKLADRQSSSYSKRDIRMGRGNKMSNQGVWTLNALADEKNDHGINLIAQALYDNNTNNWAKFREYALSTGIDIDQGGFIRPGNGIYALGRGKTYKDANGKTKRYKVSNTNDINAPLRINPTHFKRIPSIEVRQKYSANPEERAVPTESNNSHPGVRTFDSSDDFIRELGTHGGEFMLPKGMHIRMMSGIVTNAIPIMGHNVRRSMRVDDDTVKISDYNRYYKHIYDLASKFYSSPTKKNLNTYNSEIQGYYDDIQTKVINDELGGMYGEFTKGSIMRKKLMDVRAPHSAYDVATVNPNLNINTIAVDPRTYHDLTLDHKDKNGNYDRKNDYVLIHRDPCISTSSARAFKVVEDPHLIGMTWKQLSQVKDKDKLPTGTMQMNPYVDAMFNGDFDGDHYGIKYISHSPKIQRNLRKIDVPHNLLKDGADSPKTVLNTSMDFVSDAIKSGKVESAMLANKSQKSIKEFDEHMYSSHISPLKRKIDGLKSKKLHAENDPKYKYNGKRLSLVDCVNNTAYSKDEQEAIKKANPKNIAPSDALNIQLVNIVFASDKLAQDPETWAKKLINSGEDNKRLAVSNITSHSSDSDKKKAIKNLIDISNHALKKTGNPDEAKYNIAGILTDDYLKDVTRGSASYGSAIERISGKTKADKEHSILKSYAKMVCQGAKGSPSALLKFSNYLKGKAGIQASEDQQVGDGVKSDLTGMIGTKTQAIEMIAHDIHADLNNPTGALSNGNLQIKHHTETKGYVLDAVMNHYRNLTEPAGTPKHPKITTGSRYKNSFKDVTAENQTPITDKYANDLENMATDKQSFYKDGKGDNNNKIAMNFDKLMKEHGAPLDLISYRANGVGGYDTFRRLACQVTNGNPRSLFEGVNIRSMIPKQNCNAYYLEKGQIIDAQIKDPKLKHNVHLNYEDNNGKKKPTLEFTDIKRRLDHLRKYGIKDVSQLGASQIISKSNGIILGDKTYHTVLDDEKDKADDKPNKAVNKTVNKANSKTGTADKAEINNKVADKSDNKSNDKSNNKTKEANVRTHGIYHGKDNNYYEGNMALLLNGHKRIGFSGARAMENDPEAQKRTARVVDYLTNQNNITVSGLAKGSDAIVHKQTLRNGGKTIAYLPSPINNNEITPAKNRSLAKQIAKYGGLLASQYPSGAPYSSSHYMQRNKQIVDNSSCLVATQVRLNNGRSGTLNTINYAHQQGKPIYIIPENNIVRDSDDKNLVNEMLEHRYGAKPIPKRVYAPATKNAKAENEADNVYSSKKPSKSKSDSLSYKDKTKLESLSQLNLNLGKAGSNSSVSNRKSAKPKVASSSKSMQNILKEAKELNKKTKTSAKGANSNTGNKDKRASDSKSLDNSGISINNVGDALKKAIDKSQGKGDSEGADDDKSAETSANNKKIIQSLNNSGYDDNQGKQTGSNTKGDNGKDNDDRDNDKNNDKGSDGLDDDIGLNGNDSNLGDSSDSGLGDGDDDTDGNTSDGPDIGGI